MVRVEGETPLTPGDTVGLLFPEDRLHFFDAAGLAVRKKGTKNMGIIRLRLPCRT